MKKEKFKEEVTKNMNKAVEYTKQQITKGIQKTRELKFYLFNFFIRLSIFLTVLILYIIDKQTLVSFMYTPFWHKINILHIIWLFFMCMMCLHLIPNNRLTMAWKKARESEYRPVDNYDEFNLLKFVKKQNQRAWQVMLIWISFNAIFGALYLFNILCESDMLMLSVFYFLCDYICILFFCPFQTGIMKNKCCINCRIYDWGHFMMFTPMVFVKSFYSWSLFFTSLVVLIHWEIQYSNHPERFWEGSNKTLQCANCKERTCQIKRTIKSKLNSKIKHNAPSCVCQTNDAQNKEENLEIKNDKTDNK